MNARLNNWGEGEGVLHLSGLTLPLAPSRQGRGDIHWNPAHG